jgi:tetratricopeptide (TPR) repeat protein
MVEVRRPFRVESGHCLSAARDSELLRGVANGGKYITAAFMLVSGFPQLAGEGGMASIFLSYARADAPKAERIARAFEKAGHSVWWDRQVHAGSRFTAEIDQALSNADAVVVLWSKQSVTSGWVQDEAAAGRDSGRLFPVLIESVAPPLGFRQYQAIDLSGWSGRGRPPGLGALVEAIGQKGSDDSVPNLAEPVTTPPNRVRKRSLVGVLVLLPMAAAAAGLAWWLVPRAGAPTLLISSVDSGATGKSEQFAAQIAVDLTRFHPASLETLDILNNSPSNGSAKYHAEVGLTDDGKTAHVDLSLKVNGRIGVSWAEGIDEPSGRSADLRQRTASALASTLGCALEADRSKARISTLSYQKFLDGCSAIKADYSAIPVSDLVPMFEEVTRSAPDFAPGFAFLALAQSKALSGDRHPRPELIAAVRSGRVALKRAKQLDSSLEEVIAADALFHPFDKDQWNHAFPIIESGLRLHPSSATLLGLKSAELISVGRMTEGTDAARDALGFDPLSVGAYARLVDSLAYSNRIKAAYDELTKAEAIWPDAADLADCRYRLDLRFGDPRQALKTMQSASNDASVHDAGWQKFIAARIDPSAAAADAAIESFRGRYRVDPSDISAYLQSLGTFGRVDEAFEATNNPVTVDSLEAATDILFRPNMRSIRNDPRFIGLAAKLGLLAFWQRSGAWPDFCSDPELPYDCKKEAAKYGQ